MQEDFWQKKLEERKAQHAFRELRSPVAGMTDLCSNDYLGIVRNNLLRTDTDQPMGSTGSRLLTGNSRLSEETEILIAGFHRAEAALIFNSGYDANIGLLSSVAQRGDTIFYDQLSHASIRDGIRLSFAQSFSFLHNDLADLENKLKKPDRGEGTVFIVTESIFSMDGDICPLQELVKLCQEYDARLIIDEAHATAMLGEKGEGLVQLLGLESMLFARVHTFGKACGAHGAVVLGSATLKDHLINFARSFMYSTALPGQAIAHIRNSYKLFPAMSNERKHLQELIRHFRAITSGWETGSWQIKPSETAIQAIIIPGNEAVKRVAGVLQENKLDARPILYPTVPRGQERLRIVLHSFNEPAELDFLLKCLENSR